MPNGNKSLPFKLNSHNWLKYFSQSEGEIFISKDIRAFAHMSFHAFGAKIKSHFSHVGLTIHWK